MMNDKERLYDREKKSFVIAHNLRGDSITEWTEQYQANENYRQNRRKNQIYYTHEILSFHKDDMKNISVDKLEDIARQYIDERNPRGLYVAVPHFDREHFHIHCCVSRIEYKTGKSLRLDKKQLLILKKNMELYQEQKYPELSRSAISHGQRKKVKALLSEKEYQMKLRTGRATDKEQLLTILKTCYKKSISQKDFFLRLKECGLKTYERGGKISGIHYKGKKFRLARMGFTQERLQDLEVGVRRERELERVRRGKKEKERGIRR